MINIREAMPSDITTILHLIKELAQFERLSEQVSANETVLYHSLFRDVNSPKVLLAEAEDEAVGFVLYYFNFSSFLGKKGIYIEDLFIRPNFRGQGIGENLLRRICEIAKANKCGRIEGRVLDWNKEALRFYTKAGATALEEWTVYRMSERNFEQFACRKHVIEVIDALSRETS